MYPANFPGLGEALIFFCLLFFHQGKAPAGAAKFAGYMNGLVPGKLPCPGRGVCNTPLHLGTRQKNTSEIHCCESLTLLPYPNSVEMSDSPQ